MYRGTAVGVGYHAREEGRACRVDLAKQGTDRDVDDEVFEAELLTRVP